MCIWNILMGAVLASPCAFAVSINPVAMKQRWPLCGIMALYVEHNASFVSIAREPLCVFWRQGMYKVAEPVCGKMAICSEK